MEEGKEYRDKIIEIVNLIDNKNMLEYIYYFIKEKVKAG